MNNVDNSGNDEKTRVASLRDVYLDNVKGLLIACVVFGHMAILVYEKTESLSFIYRTIYLFHMPLFVFVSGYFSKSIVKRGLRVDKICSMIILAFLYRIILQASDSHLSLEFFTKQLFYFGTAPWYLLSLATWYMLVPLFERMKPIVAISLSILLAICAGGYSQIGQVLSLSRTLVFLPYFLLGFYCKRDTLTVVRNSCLLNYLSIGIAISLILYLYHTKYAALTDSYYLVYGDSCYRSGIRNGMSFRIIYSMLACIISIPILCLAPSRPLPILTKLGENTLQIYIIHRLLRAFAINLGIFEMQSMTNEYLAPVIVLIVSIVVITICMLPVFNIPLRWIMIESGKLFTKSQLNSSVQ